jgi:hypothetical protein
VDDISRGGGGAARHLADDRIRSEVLKVGSPGLAAGIGGAVHQQLQLTAHGLHQALQVLAGGRLLSSPSSSPAPVPVNKRPDFFPVLLKGLSSEMD